MFVKITNDKPVKFPYTVGQFRRDNPHTSFPKVIPVTMLRRHGVFPVEELPQPSFNPLVQYLVKDGMPHKEVIRLKTEEDATDPITGEVDQDQVGQPIYGNRWFIGWSIKDKTHQVASNAVRHKRDSLLQETDWMALSDNTLSSEWATYRQALRDITDHPDFPYLAEADWPVKP